MSLEPDNPYASPEAADAALPPGSMPGSVKLAIGCLLVFAALTSEAVAHILWRPRLLAYLWGFLLPPIVACVLAAGLAQRKRRVRFWAALLCLGGGVLMTIFAIGLVGDLLRQLQAGGGKELWRWWRMLHATLTSSVLWTAFVALGLQASLRYFAGDAGSRESDSVTSQRKLVPRD